MRSRSQPVRVGGSIKQSGDKSSTRCSVKRDSITDLRNLLLDGVNGEFAFNMVLEAQTTANSFPYLRKRRE